MPFINLQIVTQKNNKLAISPEDLKTYYLYGIPLPSNLDDSYLEYYIQSCTTELENYLQIKLVKQVVEETINFNREGWISWGYLKSSYPISCPIKLDGFLGTTKQVSYPSSWLSTKRTNDNKYSRILNLVPNRNSTHSEAIIYSGLFPQTNYFAQDNIPNYWSFKYISGFDTIPEDLRNLLGMMVCANILQQISDMLVTGMARQVVDANGQPVLIQNGAGVGFGLGLSSKSVSIDGLSQSYSSYISGQGGLFSARMKDLLVNLNPAQPGSLMKRAYDTYGAITWGVC